MSKQKTIQVQCFPSDVAPDRKLNFKDSKRLELIVLAVDAADVGKWQYQLLTLATHHQMPMNVFCIGEADVTPKELVRTIRRIRKLASGYSKGGRHSAMRRRHPANELARKIRSFAAHNPTLSRSFIAAEFRTSESTVGRALRTKC